MSKEKLLLVGAGGFGRMVAEQASRQYDCAFVDDGQVVGAEVCGILDDRWHAPHSLGTFQKSMLCLQLESGITSFGHRYLRKQKHLGLHFPTLLRLVPTSVRMLKLDMAV